MNLNVYTILIITTSHYHVMTRENLPVEQKLSSIVVQQQQQQHRGGNA